MACVFLAYGSISFSLLLIFEDTSFLLTLTVQTEDKRAMSQTQSQAENVVLVFILDNRLRFYIGFLNNVIEIMKNWSERWQLMCNLMFHINTYLSYIIFSTAFKHNCLYNAIVLIHY